jgi:hypothetical protein
MWGHKTATGGVATSTSRSRSWGYTFRPRKREVRSWRIHRRTNDTLKDLARSAQPSRARLNELLGRFGQTQMHPLLRRSNSYLVRWARNKDERLRAFVRLKAAVYAARAGIA